MKTQVKLIDSSTNEFGDLKLTVQLADGTLTYLLYQEGTHWYASSDLKELGVMNFS